MNSESLSAHGARVVTKVRGKSSLSHLNMFMIGWCYYLAIPILAGRLGWFESWEAFEMMERYCSPQASWWPILIAYVGMMPVMFLLGAWLAQSLPRVRSIRTPLAQGTQILLPIYALLLAGSAIAVRSSLFQGYGNDTDPAAAGPIATLQMALLLQYLASKAGGQSTARGLGALLAISSVLLLGMGGRLYVLSTLAAIYFYWWKFTASGPTARRRSMVALLLAPLFFGAVGMWRLGFFDISTFGFFLFAEPLFTSIPAFTMMEGHGWSLLAMPSDFLSAFINIVPTPLWPDKGSMLVSLADSPLPFESPFGAISIVTSTIGNFGLLGGPMFVAVVGFVMERVRRASGSPAGRALYCYLCCLLPFMFFRDPFQVQVKVVLTGFILIWVNRLLGLLGPTPTERPA
jgi:hypothetical protein